MSRLVSILSFFFPVLRFTLTGTSPISPFDLDHNLVPELIPGILEFLPGKELNGLIHTPFQKYCVIELGEAHTMKLFTDREFRSKVEARQEKLTGACQIQIKHDHRILNLSD